MSKQYHPPTGAQPVLSAWAKATVKKFSEEIAAVPKDRADIMSVKAEKLRELSERLRYIKELERFAPRELTEVVLKKKYKCVEVLEGHASWVLCLQVLPDGRIVSGSDDGTILIWSRDVDGAWQSEVLEGHSGSVYCLQVLPDGCIVSGGLDCTLRIWSRGVDGKWQSEVLEGQGGTVWCLQVLPGGRIFSGDEKGILRIWDGIPVGKAS
jgi:WD40 repeat protein